MHACVPMAVNWHVSQRALPRRQSLSQASATDSDDDGDWLRDDLLSDDDPDLAHAPNKTHSSRSRGAEADGNSTL